MRQSRAAGQPLLLLCGVLSPWSSLGGVSAVGGGSKRIPLLSCAGFHHWFFITDRLDSSLPGPKQKTSLGPLDEPSNRHGIAGAIVPDRQNGQSNSIFALETDTIPSTSELGDYLPSWDRIDLETAANDLKPRASSCDHGTATWNSSAGFRTWHCRRVELIWIAEWTELSSVVFFSHETSHRMLIDLVLKAAVQLFNGDLVLTCDQSVETVRNDNPDAESTYVLRGDIDSTVIFDRRRQFCRPLVVPSGIFQAAELPLRPSVTSSRSPTL